MAAYARLARQSGLTSRSRPFVASTLVGATSMTQLKENLGSAVLSAEQLQAIEQIHLRFPNPAP